MTCDTAIVSHQFCSPRLGFPVGGRACRKGRWEGGGGGWTKYSGWLWLFITLKRINKNFPTQLFLLKFNRINSLLSFPLKFDVSTTTSFSPLSAEWVLNFQETDQSLWTSPNKEDTPISYPLSHSRDKRWKVVAGTFNSLHEASSPSGLISLYRKVVFVMVHISLILHVILTLQPCISDTLLFITGVTGLPLINENNTAII